MLIQFPDNHKIVNVMHPVVLCTLSFEQYDCRDIQIHACYILCPFHSCMHEAARVMM